MTDLGFSDADYAALAQYAVVTYGDGDQLDALGPLPAAQIVAIFRDTERQRTHACPDPAAPHSRTKEH